MVAEEPPVPTSLEELQGRGGECPPFAPMVVDHVRASVKALKRATQRLPEGPRILTDTFYRELFILAPDARDKFADDITPQSERLLGALLDAAEGMDDPAEVEQQLRIWGVIHRRVYHIDDSYYVYVGQALVRTIKAFMPEASSVLYSSWAAVYAWMAAVMIDGANKADAKRKTPRAPLQGSAQTTSYSTVPSQPPEADVIHMSEKSHLSERSHRARRAGRRTG